MTLTIIMALLNLKTSLYCADNYNVDEFNECYELINDCVHDGERFSFCKGYYQPITE